MPRLSYTSLAEQVAQKIRDGLRDGHWIKTMPGRKALAIELGVNHKTCEAALKILEAEGLLVSEGRGRGRRIVELVKGKPKKLKVTIFLYERAAARDPVVLELLFRLREAGHDAQFSSQSLRGLGMNVGRIARYVKKTDTDAWIVLAGPSDVLEWFSQAPVPAFALYGRLSEELPLAAFSVSKLDAMGELVDQLVDLGHRRIVLLTREERRKPVPGYFERHFLEMLEEHGIATSAYNLPDWQDSPNELQRVLKSLFSQTPPTALIVDDPSVFIAVMQQLARLGFNAPEQVSLACTDDDSNFNWCLPTIAHLQWDAVHLVKRVDQWVHHLSIGKNDLRKTKVKAKLHDGGTIGPVPK